MPKPISKTIVPMPEWCSLRQCVQWIVDDLIPVPYAYEAALNRECMLCSDGFYMGQFEAEGKAKSEMLRDLVSGELVAYGYRTDFPADYAGSLSEYGEPCFDIDLHLKRHEGSHLEEITASFWKGVFRNISWNYSIAWHISKETAANGNPIYEGYGCVLIKTTDLLAYAPPEGGVALPPLEISRNDTLFMPVKSYTLQESLYVLAFGQPDHPVDENGEPLELEDKQVWASSKKNIERRLKDGLITANGHLSTTLYNMCGDWEMYEWTQHEDDESKVPQRHWKLGIIDWDNSSVKTENGEYAAVTVSKKAIDVLRESESEETHIAIALEVKKKKGRTPEIALEEKLKEALILALIGKISSDNLNASAMELRCWAQEKVGRDLSEKWAHAFLRSIFNEVKSRKNN